MKTKLPLIVLLLFVFSACQTSGNNDMFLDFSEISDRWLIGIGENESTSLFFETGGLFKIKKGDEIYTGTWVKDESTKMYQFTVQWIENGVQFGYFMHFTNIDGEKHISGQWFLTDIYMTLSIVFEYE